MSFISTQEGQIHTQQIGCTIQTHEHLKAISLSFQTSFKAIAHGNEFIQVFKFHFGSIHMQATLWDIQEGAWVPTNSK